MGGTRVNIKACESQPSRGRWKKTNSKGTGGHVTGKEHWQPRGKRQPVGTGATPGGSRNDGSILFGLNHTEHDLGT